MMPIQNFPLKLKYVLMQKKYLRLYANQLKIFICFPAFIVLNIEFEYIKVEILLCQTKYISYWYKLYNCIIVIIYKFLFIVPVPAQSPD